MNTTHEIDLDDFVNAWTRSGRNPIGSPENSDESFEALLEQIEFLSEKAFSRYVPALFSRHSPVFKDRLLKWLQNECLTEDDKVAMFQFVLRLAYFSFDDFLSLYDAAFVGAITRWVWDRAGLHLDGADYKNELIKQRNRHTWYASVTDSMVISEFYHVNSITGVKFRPNFLVLKEFALADGIRRFMDDAQLSRLVLLEDFVGTGDQASGVVRWALENLAVPILFCPMVICPDGDNKFRRLEQEFPGQLKYEPVMLLGDTAFASRSGGTSDPIMTHIKELADRIHHHIAGGCLGGGPPYSSHGYRLTGNTATGATVVMFSNTPDNSLPLIHFHSPLSKWSPLFPRVSRETT